MRLPRFHPLYIKWNGVVGWYICDSVRERSNDPIVPMTDNYYKSREAALLICAALEEQHATIE
jgi:hypothetical protein